MWVIGTMAAAIGRTDGDIAALFLGAVELHQAGRLREARERYEAVLGVDPVHFDALHLLGLVFIDGGRPEVGVSLIERAVLIDPAVAPALSNLGKGLNDLGRPAEALERLDRALALGPGFADAHNNRGLSLHALGRWSEALDSFETALRLEPRLGPAHNNRGLALQALGRHEEALACYDAAIGLHPAYAAAHNNRATALQALGRSDEALASAERAIELHPGYANAHYNRAIALVALERREAALASFEAALDRHPGLVEAHYNCGLLLNALDRPAEALASFDEAIALGATDAFFHGDRARLLEQLERLDEALAAYDAALALRPDAAELHNHRGIVLQRLQRPEEALVSYERAVALDPGQAPHHTNRALALHQLRRFDEAIESFDAAIARHAEPANARFARGLTLLLLGRLQEGFEEYRWRWRRTDGLQAMPNLPFPLWEGQNLSGRSILVHCEQGFGDSLQFIRYARPLAAIAARVRVVAQPQLVGLFRSIPAIDVQADFDETPHDYHVPLMCLPRLLGTTLDTIPAETPYLRPDPEKVKRWAERVSASTAPLKVGLVWAGSARKHNPSASAIDRRRSMSLALFAPLADVAGAEFFSLQKGEPATVQAQDAAGGLRLVDLTTDLDDFGDTAALIANLGLVITVDTAVAHLAGALGKPVWILSRHDGCWRWLNGREDSPWYPTARLFHQTAPGAWGAVVERVANELASLAKGVEDGRIATAQR